MPLPADTTMQVLSHPSWAAVSTALSPGDFGLSIDVAQDAPLGRHAIALSATRAGSTAEFDWPFTIVERTLESRVESWETPEALALAFVEALVAGDDAAVGSLVPDSAASVLDALDGFEPTLGDGPCERFDGARAHCFIFDQQARRVIGLTMDRVDLGWSITSVALDSTD